MILVKKIPLFLFPALLLLYGCSGKKAGIKTAKEAADLFIESLKENDFKKFTALVPTKSDAHDMLGEMKMSDEQRKKSHDRIDEAFSKKDPMVEMKSTFDFIRDRYPPVFWKNVKIESYEGLEPSKENDIEGAEVFINLKSSIDSSTHELKLGEIIKIKGRWLLMTQPRWI